MSISKDWKKICSNIEKVKKVYLKEVTYNNKQHNLWFCSVSMNDSTEDLDIILSTVIKQNFNKILSYVTEKEIEFLLIQQKVDQQEELENSLVQQVVEIELMRTKITQLTEERERTFYVSYQILQTCETILNQCKHFFTLSDEAIKKFNCGISDLETIIANSKANYST